MEVSKHPTSLLLSGSAIEELEFDDILSLAAHICSVPVAKLNLVGTSKVWGTHLTDTPFELDSLNAKLPFEYRVPLVHYNEVIGYISILGYETREINKSEHFSLEKIAKIAVSRLKAKLDAIEHKLRSDSIAEKQNEFLNAVLDNLADGIVACNEKGELTVFNRATKEFHGLDSSNIPQDQWSQHYHLLDADGETILKTEQIPLIRAFNEGSIKNVAMWIVEAKNGRRRELLCNGRSIYSRSGKKLGAVIAMTDVTEINQIRSEKEQGAKMLKSLINTSPHGINVIGLDGRIQLWNPGAEKIFGWTSEEVVGNFMPYADEKHREQVFQSINKVIFTRQSVEKQSSRINKFGKTVDVNITILPLFNDQNEIYAVMSVIVDISAIKERESKLLEANRALEAASVAKSDFLANMSHEIRTPLNGVLGMTELMLAEERTSAQDEKLRVISSSTHSLITIISDILDFSKIEAGKLELEKVSFNFDTVIDESYEVLRTLADSKGITLVKKSPHNRSKSFLGDPGRVRQVLVNLVGNAIKFSEGGEVRTRLNITDGAEGKKVVRIEVQDMGIGIHPEALKNLFQAFSQADSSTTRRFGGTGLGLSISKRLVSLMSGTIGVESELGSGSTFWFEITLDPSDVVESFRPLKPDVTASPAQISAARILVVEDNSTNQKVALALLQKLGYKADIATNGQHAIEVLSSKQYDIILMDCQMPIMDGYQATKVIRTQPNLQNQIKIIALTANSMKGDRERCIGAGMDDYLAKPLGLASLQAILKKHVA